MHLNNNNKLNKIKQTKIGQNKQKKRAKENAQGTCGCRDTRLYT